MDGGARRRRSVRLGAAVAMVAAVAATESAAAAWTQPAQLSDAGQDAARPQVAIDADGDSVFTWERPVGPDRRIQAVTRSAAGALGPVINLSAAGADAFNPQVDVDSDGDAVFSWERFVGDDIRMQVVRRSAAGVLGPVLTISAPGESVSFSQLAVDPDGDAIITWARSDGTVSRIQARAFSAAGVLSGVQNVSPAGGNAAFPDVAIDDGGGAVLAWQRFDGAEMDCCNRIQARARSAAGVLSAVQTLSAGTRNAINAQVGVDADGDAVFTWRRFDESEPFCCDRIQARARSAAGVLSATQNLSAPGVNGSQMQVAVDADGDAVFGWTIFDESAGGCCNRIQVRSRTAGGVLGPLQFASAAGQSASQPDLGIEPDGDSILIWRRSNGANNLAQARTRSAAGVLGMTDTLSLQGQNAVDPVIAVDPDGDAAAAWRRSDGTDDRIEAAFGP